MRRWWDPFLALALLAVLTFGVLLIMAGLGLL